MNQQLATTELFTGIEAIENFTRKINQPPEVESVRINKMANDSKYLPISFIQTLLDEEYAGLWNWTFEHEQVIANEIIGRGILEVFHPVAKTWIKRSGTAAVMIQQKSMDKGGSGRISNIDDKIKNTLVKDFPHLESECLKSAAKKLGKKFGRDLNREFQDEYNPIYQQEIEFAQVQAELEAKINICNDINSLNALWGEYKDYQSNPRIKKLFSSKKAFLNIKK